MKEVSLGYENVEVKYIGGHSPEIHFLDEAGAKVEVSSLFLFFKTAKSLALPAFSYLTFRRSLLFLQTIDLAPLSTTDCEKLLIDHGFKKKVMMVLCKVAAARLVELQD